MRVFQTRLMSILLVMLVCAALGFAQGTTAALDGYVKDPQGATVADAQVEVVNAATGAIFKTTSDERGHWVLPSMAVGSYRVTVTKSGFNTKTIQGVSISAGVPATVNADLEIGAVTQTVEVSAGAEIVQTTSATVSNTLTTQLVSQLPTSSRNSLYLLLGEVGVQTLNNPRYSQVNGLPLSSLNITIDGVNTQDNSLKGTSGAFYSFIYTPQDAIEEVTLTTSAAGVNASAEGGAQIAFTTKGGSNAYHGGAFWQHRNTALNANQYFNNINGLKRPIIILNQGGFHVGGPILKDKLLFFVNYEIYKMPSATTVTRTILTPEAMSGIFTYKGTGTTGIQKVNVYDLVRAKAGTVPANARFVDTPDPTMLKTYQAIWTASQSGGVLTDRILSNDYNHLSLSFQPKGMSDRKFLTDRLDYNITQKHTLSLTSNYDWYGGTWDTLNGVTPVYPGAGMIIGTDIIGGQRGVRPMGTVALRSTLTARMTNEVRFGFMGGNTMFREPLENPGDAFSQWHGYNPNPGNNVTIASSTTASRRTTPTRNFGDTVTVVKGSHQMSFGGTFSQAANISKATGNTVIHGVAFGYSGNDPLYYPTASSPFNTTVMPGTAAGDSNMLGARDLYVTLTGRMSSITRNLAYDAATKKYGFVPAVTDQYIKEMGFFAQDTWRVRPSLTLSGGIRYTKQYPLTDRTLSYSRVSQASLWGVSGIGNWFNPGYMPGASPVYDKAGNTPAYTPPSVWAPSAGIAWQLPKREGILGKLLGNHQGATVLRVGFGIATTREGTGTFDSLWGSNPGRTATASVSSASQAADWGPWGSVLFRDYPNWPTRTLCTAAGADPANCAPVEPTYPIIPSFTQSLNDFDPTLKVGYVASWNIGLQRELNQSTVVEVRFVGNHGVHQWRQINLNEVNIVENGFLKEFQAATNNLIIARQDQKARGLSPNSTNFANQGLPGQADLPMITAALTPTGLANATWAGYMLFPYHAGTTNPNDGFYLKGQAGSAASAIATNSTNFPRFLAAFPNRKNWFLVNPDVGNGGAWVLNNDGASFYDALQIELRRRTAAGLTAGGSYVFAKSMRRGSATNSDTDAYQPTTFRNTALDKGLSTYNIRHAIKLNWVYELPLGPGKRFLSSGNPIVKKVLEGWQVAGVGRLQSGNPISLGSTYNTFNGEGSGIELHNITEKQIQDMIKVYKITSNTYDASLGRYPGLVLYLPQSFIDNTNRAYDTAGTGYDGRSLTRDQLDPNAPYIGPVTEAGKIGWTQSYGHWHLPWGRYFDMNVTKRTKIGEGKSVELRMQALNLFNVTNWTGGYNTGAGTSFGRVTSAYSDLTGTVDTGKRMVEFQLRFSF